MKSALSGIKVLDLSRILAGPWCSQSLADLGAEVIKIESPQCGDDTRSWGPPFLTSKSGASRVSAYFLCCNRGKRSIAIDFAQSDGRELLHKLIAQSDILIENFKSGVLRKYGLDYESAKATRPDIIYASITGFGQSGPLAERPGYDYVLQGMAGFMSFTGIADGSPGAGPLRAGVAIADLMTGMYATVAVLAALRHRDHTGQGQYLDLALLDAAVALNANQNMNYLLSGVSPRRSGNAHPNCAPYDVFQCKDGALILAIGNDGQFARFCAAVGRNELAEDPRFRTNGDRVENAGILRPEVAKIMQQRDRQEWGRLLDAASVPWGPIESIAEVFANEQVMHRELLQFLEHPKLGRIPTVRNPIVPVAEVLPPPMLGEHTDEILGEIGVSAAAIAGLRARQVVA